MNKFSEYQVNVSFICVSSTDTIPTELISDQTTQETKRLQNFRHFKHTRQFAGNNCSVGLSEVYCRPCITQFWTVYCRETSANCLQEQVICRETSANCLQQQAVQLVLMVPCSSHKSHLQTLKIKNKNKIYYALFLLCSILRFQTCAFFIALICLSTLIFNLNLTFLSGSWFSVSEAREYVPFRSAPPITIDLWEIHSQNRIEHVYKSIRKWPPYFQRIPSQVACNEPANALRLAKLFQFDICCRTRCNMVFVPRFHPEYNISKDSHLPNPR